VVFTCVKLLPLFTVSICRFQSHPSLQWLYIRILRVFQLAQHIWGGIVLYPAEVCQVALKGELIAYYLQHINLIHLTILLILNLNLYIRRFFYLLVLNFISLFAVSATGFCRVLVYLLVFVGNLLY